MSHEEKREQEYHSNKYQPPSSIVLSPVYTVGKIMRSYRKKFLSSLIDSFESTSHVPYASSALSLRRVFAGDYISS